MNAGPGGFADAPVTKAIVLATAAASILANAGRAPGAAAASAAGAGPAAAAALGALPRPLRPLAFASTGEMLTGLAMLYSGRLLERQSGTSQYGAYAAVVAGAAALLQAALSAAASSSSSSSSPALALLPPSLPLAFAFAGLVPFAADVPPQAHFSLLGVPCTDKAFGYLAAAHAVWAAGARRGLLSAVAGLAAGLLYRLNVFGVQRLRLPRWLCFGGRGGGSSAGASSGRSSGGCPPPRVLVPPVLDPAAAAAAGGFGGGDFGGPGRAGGRGPEQLQAQPQMMRRRR